MQWSDHIALTKRGTRTPHVIAFIVAPLVGGSGSGTSTLARAVTVQAKVLELLQDLQRERGLGCLFVSHDLAVVELLASHIAVLNKGTLVESKAQRRASPDRSDRGAIYTAGSPCPVSPRLVSV